MSLPDRFWAKTAVTDCINWTGAQNSKGYGCFAIDGKAQLAHHLAWEDERGPIPEGMTIDHLCRNRACVNVEHLEVVTNVENQRRTPGVLRPGGECVNGHPISTEADIYISPRGRRECRGCRRLASRRASGRAA